MIPITVALTPECNTIWQKCSGLGHEMIISSKIQRIFPTMEFMISGLSRSKFYTLSMQMERTDIDNTTAKNDPSTSTVVDERPKIVYHPKNAQSGSEWMSTSVSFDDVRITSNKSVEMLSENFIHLRPGHCYQPILIVYEEDKPICTSRIEHMAFTVTTTYQNKDIKEYKSLIINKFSSLSDKDEKEGILSNSKRDSAMGPPAKQSNLDYEDEPQSIMPRSLSITTGSGGYPGEESLDQKPEATPKSKEPRVIKSEVTTPLPATPMSCMQFMKPEVESKRPAGPAPLITTKSIEVEASGSEEATPVEHMIQEAPAPNATESSARRSPHPLIENVSQDNVASPDVRPIRIDSIPGPSLPPMIQRDRPRDPRRDPPILEEFIQAYDIPGLGPHPRANQYQPGLPYSFIAFCEDPFWTNQRTVPLPRGIMIPPRPFDYAERERLNDSPPPADPNWMPPPGTPPIAALADALAFRDRLQQEGNDEDSDADN